MKKILFLIVVVFSFPLNAKECFIGDLYYGKGDMKNAFTFYSSCAGEGNIKSQYNLGNFYYLGKGTSKSFKDALIYYNKAAENGFAPAQVKAALMYWRGEGDHQNLSKALALLILASDGKDRKWFYPAMENGLGAENEDTKAKQYAKQLLAITNEKQKNDAVIMASDAKFNLLKKKAKEILNSADYYNFLDNININKNDRRKIDAIILDLHKKYLSLKKNNE